MNWNELALKPTANFSFANSERLIITHAPSDENGHGRARIETSVASIVLDGVVDDAETAEAPRVFVISGTPSNALVLLGGTRVYHVDSLGHSQILSCLDRDMVNTEFWSMRLLLVQLGVVVVYEGGVLLVNRDLGVRWHVRKFYNDLLDRVEQDHLWFLEDHEQPWSINLGSGANTTRSDELGAVAPC